MALNFNTLPPEMPVPDTPPSRFVWTVVFLVLVLVGIFVVLLLWPAEESTRTPWFWTCVTVYPAGVAGFVVSRVFSVYEGRRLRAMDWNAAAKKFAERAFAKESIPLRILGAAMRVTEDDADNNVQKIVDRKVTLDTKASEHAVDQAIAARWLQPRDARLASNEAERHTMILEWLYDELLADLDEPLAALPSDIPVSVLLDVSGYVGRADVAELWQKQWRSHELRDARVERAHASLDLMRVDAWLDGQDGTPPFERAAVLLVSVSLSTVLDEDPPDGTAEIGMGLLMTSAGLAGQHALRPVASLHRPLRSGSENLNHALTYALRWGNANLDSLGAAWMIGSDGESVGPLHTAINYVSAGKPREEPLAEHDLDRTVGHSGQSAGWLAATCAALRAADSSRPQLIAQRLGEQTVVAVVTGADHEPNDTRTSA